MKTRIKSVVAIAVATLACGDATGVEPKDLAGTWHVTVAIVTNPANTTQTADLIARGLSMTMELMSDGRVIATFDDGTSVDIEMGTLTVNGNDVLLVLDGSSSVGTISRNGDVMMLTLANGVEWDFANDGVDAPATLQLELIRVS